MRVLMTGGGTGGHVYPALAIAEIIKTNVPDAEIAFVGTKKGIENRLVPAEKYPLYHVEIQGISRSLSPKNIRTAYLILVSPHRSKKIIEEFKPDIVIGTGGYVSWPLLCAASDMGIPCMVHESNAYAGLAVRQLQKRVDKILTSFEETAEHLKCKDKVVNVGNPLRQKYGAIDKMSARRKLGIPDSAGFVVLSFGGSLGADAINEASMAVMRSFSLTHGDVFHFHACGTRNYEALKEEYKSISEASDGRISASDYIYDMPLYMSAADLIICRAGAMTLAEIATLSKPAILIPSPNVTENHQYKNAKVIADGGGAVLVEENGDMCRTVCESIEKIYSDRELCDRMGKNIHKFARLDAGKRIYEEIVKLINKK